MKNIITFITIFFLFCNSIPVFADVQSCSFVIDNPWSVVQVPDRFRYITVCRSSRDEAFDYEANSCRDLGYDGFVEDSWHYDGDCGYITGHCFKNEKRQKYNVAQMKSLRCNKLDLCIEGSLNDQNHGKEYFEKLMLLRNKICGEY